jgi:hypothetical protein
MANTALREIYDYFLMTITDYRLIDLFETSEPDFENYLQSWLAYAVTEFTICDQDIDFDEVTEEFPVVLTRENKIILATLMMKYWLQKNVNDITQMNLHVTDRDFKTASEALNLREKAAYLNIVKEQCSQLLNDYGYKKVDWAEWFAQDFGS